MFQIRATLRYERGIVGLAVSAHEIRTAALYVKRGRLSRSKSVVVGGW